MAVELKKEIKSFWPSQHKKFTLLTLGLALVIPIFLIVIMLLADSKISWLILAVASISSYILAVALGYVIFMLSSEALRDILNTLTHIDGEKTLESPIMPNDPKYKASGVGSAIDLIYSLESNSTKAPTGNASDTLLEQALKNTSTGFVVMKGGVISYANDAAPIIIDSDGKKQLKLIFNGNDNLDNWLAKCRENSVNGEKIWTRVSNELPEESNVKYFDVLASFHRDSDYEVILSIIDKTNSYATSEESLNFIAFAAHELRGPITVIKGYLDVLEDELGNTLNEDHQELLRRLKVSANRLSGYINNILNTSRYDRRHLKIRLAKENIADIYDMVTEDMSLRASSQKRILNVSIPKNLPEIAADRNSLSEVFTNLIDNAIKYSNEGGIVNVSAKSDDDAVYFIVQDSGIGMPPNVISNLFQKFYRSHRSRENVSGTGIGLYISKAIVESHGGEITVSSLENKGSTFIVILPTYQALAEKINSNKNSNENIITTDSNQIKNHTLYRG